MRDFSNKLVVENGYKRQDLFFIILATSAILASALHFWPFEDSKIWQMFNIPNLCCGIAIVLGAILLITRKGRDIALSYIPHVSILAYLVINALSVSFADTLSRPLNYTLKLALVFVGGLFLFQKALSTPKMLKLFYALIVVAVSVSISVCIYTRLAFDPKQFGFHGNVFKYATYIGILVPIACVYLVSGSKRQVLWAVLIASAGMFSAGSAGAILSIFAGFIAAFLLTKKPSIRANIVFCVLLMIVIVPVSNKEAALYRMAGRNQSIGKTRYNRHRCRLCQRLPEQLLLQTAQTKHPKGL